MGDVNAVRLKCALPGKGKSGIDIKFIYGKHCIYVFQIKKLSKFKRLTIFFVCDKLISIKGHKNEQ